jgi:hypothetical protein
MRFLCIVLLVGFVFANLSATSLSQPSCAGIHLKILNIINSTGIIGCALFDSPDGFPKDFLHFASRVLVMTIRDSEARCNFEYIPPGSTR